MERNVFVQRVKRLAVWVFVIALIVCGVQQVSMSVQADDGQVTLPVTFTAEDGLLVSLKGDYTASVTISETATSASVTLPEVEITSVGCVFDNWLLNISGGGYYDPGFQQVSWDSSMPASSVVTYTGALPFSVNYHLENTINVSYVMPEDYEETVQVEVGVQTEYLESKDEDGVYGKAAITLPGVVESEDTLVFVGWKCYDASEYEREEKTEIILDGYQENYCESGISVYPEDAILEITYPTDEDNEGNNTASYVFEAQFTTAKSAKIIYDPYGGEEMEITEKIGYQQKITDTTVSFILSEKPTYEGYYFEGWLYNLEATALGGEVEIDLGEEKTFTALWIRLVSEGTRNMPNVGPYKLDEGTWKVEGDDSIYPGGMYFYVEELGEYTFIRQ